MSTIICYSLSYINKIKLAKNNPIFHILCLGNLIFQDYDEGGCNYDVIGAKHWACTLFCIDVCFTKKKAQLEEG